MASSATMDNLEVAHRSWSQLSCSDSALHDAAAVIIFVNRSLTLRALSRAWVSRFHKLGQVESWGLRKNMKQLFLIQ